MKEQLFWRLLAASREPWNGDLADQFVALENRLAELSPAAIQGFDAQLHEQRRRLATPGVLAAAESCGVDDEDGFERFRCALIAAGRKAVAQVLKTGEDPGELGTIDITAGYLLCAARNAYHTATGQEFPASEIPAHAVTTGERDTGVSARDDTATSSLLPADPGQVPAMDEAVRAFFGAAVAQVRGMGSDESTATDADGVYAEAVFLMATEEPAKLARAFELFREAAAQGHTDSQYFLGTCYQEGRGTRTDLEAALKWYRSAAEKKHADAAYSVGSFYQEGLGVRRDYKEAARWYKKGAEAGSAEAEFGLGVLHLEGWGVKASAREAIKWFARAAADGHGLAAKNLGVIHLYGRGVPADATEAARWFELSARADHPAGQYNFAVLLENGNGVERNYLKAARWYDAAARQDHADACNNLGMLYEKGRGTRRDWAKAARLYARAFELGCITAKFTVKFQKID